MSRPTNFAEQHPLLFIAAALGPGGTSQAVTDQEAVGAAQMADPACEVLPTDNRSLSDAELEQVGFVLGPVDPEDPLFREATLPKGWERRRTGHDMWTHLHDAQGCQHGAIFYKASAHDRRAFMYVRGSALDGDG